MEKQEIPVGKSNGSRHSEWQDLENMIWGEASSVRSETKPLLIYIKHLFSVAEFKINLNVCLCTSTLPTAHLENSPSLFLMNKLMDWKIGHFHARPITSWKKAWCHWHMSRILFSAKNSWMTLRMSRLLFVGSNLEVTWWAPGQWKGREIYTCIEWLSTIVKSRKLNKPQFLHFSKSFFTGQPHIFGRAFKWDEIYFRCFSNDNVRTLTSNTRTVAIGMP